MKDLLVSIAQGLVEDPAAVTVTVDEPAEDGTVVYHLHVSENEMGRDIGKHGRIAKSLRLVMKTAGGAGITMLSGVATDKEIQELTQSTNTMLIWIAAISLLVGGIGVMNIMLVSVTERTSEIGLKKALGAKKRRIRMQFLTEAAVLTSLGGIIGVASGIGLAELISNMMQIPVSVSVPAILISVVFSTIIGIVFGLVPAIKAANLNPIDALRRN